MEAKEKDVTKIHFTRGSSYVPLPGASSADIYSNRDGKENRKNENQSELVQEKKFISKKESNRKAEQSSCA